MPTRIYEYGLLPPDVNADLVFDQMRLGPRYYNKLIEIERERRTRARASLVAHPDVALIAAEVQKLSDERDQLRQKINLHRGTTRGRKGPPELIDAVKAISVTLKQRREVLKEAKKAIASDVVVAEALAKDNEWAADQVRKARAASNLYWGSYLLVEQAMDSARKSKTDPEFRSFTGDGRVSVQLQGGLSIDEMYGEDTQVQVITRKETDSTLDAQIAAKVAEKTALREIWWAANDKFDHLASRIAHEGQTVSGEARMEMQQQFEAAKAEVAKALEAKLASRVLSKEIHALRAQNIGYCRKSNRESLHGHKITSARLRLRVQSDAKGRPVWAEWPMILDRPLPKGARIKVVTVQKRRRDSASHEWRVHIMMDVSECQLGVPGEGACALNLGWCQKAGGDLRVGYLVGGDGFEREVVLPRSVIERVEKSESIQGFRDRGRDELVAKLRAWIGQFRVADAGQPSIAPVWFLEETKALHAWKSPRRFARFFGTWKQSRVNRETGETFGGRWDGDNEGYEMMAVWNQRDRHLEQYQSGLRRGAHRHRRDIYRCVAKELATRYRTLVIDDTDLRVFQRDPRPEDAQTKIDTIARNQGHAAPHELRLALVSAFTRAGDVKKLSAVDVTRRHVACGSIEDWDRASSDRDHTCSACNVTYDQDANACRNLLREHQAASIGGEGAREAEPSVPKKESRSERLRKSRWKKPEEAPLAP